jgi:hypothetical protein
MVLVGFMMIEQRHDQGGVYGGVPWHCFGCQTSNEKTNNQKYGATLDGHCLTMQHTTTNQKHAGTMKQVYKKRCNQGGVRKGDDTIVLEGIRS